MPAQVGAGVSELRTGAASLSAGNAKLAEGAGSLNAGVQKLSGGAGNLSAGAQTLAAGTVTLQEGATSLATGIDTLEQGAGTLQSGASKLAAGATELLTMQRITRVRADPPAGQPGQHVPTTDIAYFRLHGSPRIYYSDYPADYLANLATSLQEQAQADSWCIFDNTAAGAALFNALDLQAQITA